jgi:hypothetical protein
MLTINRPYNGWIPEVDKTFVVTISFYPEEVPDSSLLIASRTEKIIVPAGVIAPDSTEEPEEWALSFLETVMRDELDEYEAVAFGEVYEYSEYHWMVDNKAPALPLIIF